jgi:hypothetical protein
VFNSPGEALVAGLVILAAQDPRVRAIVEANDREHAIEGMRNAPWFDQLVSRSLLTLRESFGGRS